MQTCLLISDDPDNQTEFSEAVYELSKESALLSISDVQRARKLLKAKVIVPDFVFLDISMQDSDAEGFLKFFADHPELTEIPVILIGSEEEYRKVRSNDFSDFFNRNVPFSELKLFLQKILRTDTTL